MLVNCTAHKPQILKGLPAVLASNPVWLRGVDLNHRPLGYEPKKIRNYNRVENYPPHAGITAGSTR
jgi:hypothetical protein